MAKPEVSKDHGVESEQDKALHDILIALQKSLSRVSAGSKESKDFPSTNARALIIGNISFELSMKVEPGGAKGDYLIYRPDGNIPLKLTGVINQDIRPKEKEPDKPA